ncbi:AraC family transcriptional regulator [Fulvivirga ligni]|uniref:AraC family transcriptional regulator n=1 Tax=Fulvivirga ligni TaxID=2904246 RepID=UPI001F2EF0D7|nr:AraC family transcriptional regulator [Fulvivirga ligni]UII24198.1 AraC family transcriptional regulator [Fulvivirga ligni]
MNKNLINTLPDRKEKSLFTLVENRSSYSFDVCELNLFETHQTAHNVDLMFNDFVLTSMLSGRKIMKLDSTPAFEYLPGESVILPPGEHMHIDFPDAEMDTPTRCIALTISQDVIKNTVNRLAEYHPKADGWGEWEINLASLHLNNTQELADTIDRIIKITKSEQGKVKDIMVQLTLQEMLIRLMQTQARSLFESSHSLWSNQNPLAAAIQYMKQNLRGKISLDEVAKIACMSRTSFFQKFKETMGETPSQYILKERIKLAQRDLESSDKNITEVCFSSGFENLSHFIRAFKQEVGCTPKSYQQNN